MAGEEWARRIVEKELKRNVVINDDGSRPGMYDLRIGAADAPEIAIECVGAVDPIRTETWNVGPAKGPVELEIMSDWSIALAPGAKVKAIRQRVELLLRELEGRGLRDARVGHVLKWHDAALFEELESLGVTHASCYRLPGTGKVYFGMEGIGGAVDSWGAAVPEWAGEFLRDPVCRDVFCKLQRSGATDRHVIVLVSFAGAPWPVESYSMGEHDELPAEAPDLPLRLPEYGLSLNLVGGACAGMEALGVYSRPEAKELTIRRCARLQAHEKGRRRWSCWLTGLDL